MFFFFILRGFILWGKRGFHLTSPHLTPLHSAHPFLSMQFFSCMPRASGGLHPVLPFRSLPPARRAFPADFPFSLLFGALPPFTRFRRGGPLPSPSGCAYHITCCAPWEYPLSQLSFSAPDLTGGGVGNGKKELFSVFSGSGFPLYRGFMYRAARKAAERGVRKRRCRGIPVIGEYDAAPVHLWHCLFRSSCIRFCTVAGGARLYPSRKECLYSGVMPPSPAASRIGGTYRKELG